MKTAPRAFYIATLVFCIGVSMPAYATTYFPFAEELRQFKEKALMRTGTDVFLFHSGTLETTNTIRVGDTLPVYREDEGCTLQKVGKVQVRSRIGKHYIKAKVIEGTLRLNDIAQKGATAFLVIVLDEHCAQ